MSNTIIKCKDCGTEFEVGTEEKAWYDSKGFELPKRCKSCRKARKGNNNGKR